MFHHTNFQTNAVKELPNYIGIGHYKVPHHYGNWVPSFSPFRSTTNLFSSYRPLCVKSHRMTQNDPEHSKVKCVQES